MLTADECLVRMRDLREAMRVLAEAPSLDEQHAADAATLLREFGLWDAVRLAEGAGCATEEDAVVAAAILLERGLVGVGAASSPTPTGPAA
jgi:phage tail sheath protein FI